MYVCMYVCICPYLLYFLNLQISLNRYIAINIHHVSSVNIYMYIDVLECCYLVRDLNFWS